MSKRGDGTTKRQTTLSLPPELVDDIDEFADESHLSSRSQTVELLTRDGLEAQEEAVKAGTEQGGEARMLATQLMLFMTGASLLAAGFAALLPLLGSTTTATALTLAAAFSAVSVGASLRAGQLANTNVVGAVVGLDGQETEEGE